MIPPAYGLQGVRAITYTGDGDDVTYWNRYVAVTQMHGHGSFVDPRVNVDVQNPPGMVEPKLRALRAYQLSLERPAAGSPDPVAAARGQAVFNGAGTCATCHVGPRFTDANDRLHAPSEVGQDPAFAQRSATKQYRTTPLRGLLQHPPYFHDGSARTLADVVAHYNRVRSLNLTEQQQRDLVEYLKSL